MDAEARGGSLSVLDYLRPVWRFKFIVGLVVALSAAGTYLYVNRQVKVYQSASKLYLGQSPLQQLLNPGNSTLTDRTIADQAPLVTTPAVARSVRRTLKLPYSAESLMSQVSVSPQASVDYMTISAQNTDPRLAAELANGFAQAYLAQRSVNLVQSAKTGIKSAQEQLRQIPRGLANAAPRNAVQQQLSTLEGYVINPPSLGQQVSQAAVSTVPIAPRPIRDAVFAAALAFVLALIACYAFDRSDLRVRRLGEIEGLFDLPVLARIPHVRRPEPSPKDPYATPVALREPHRTLRVNLDLARAAREAKVIMVTSALPEEGKSTVVRNLAISYRDAGVCVAVVEADLRRPILATQFGVSPRPGLGDVLVHGGELHLQRAPSEVDDLDPDSGTIDVAVAGGAQQDPTVLLTEDRLRDVVSRLASEYDIVLIDSPPLLPVSDGLPLLALVDGVLLVVRAGTTTHPAASRLRQTLDRINRTHRVHLLGAVANDVTDEFASRHHYKLDRKNGNVDLGSSVDSIPDSASASA